jgi:hypothetical protein
MSRKRAAPPRPKKAKLPTVIPDLPTDCGELYNHCTASWAGFTASSKLSTGIYPPAATVTTNLAALNTALTAPPGPSTTDAVNAAAEKVRQNWNLLAKYTQGVIRAGDIEDAGTVVASVLMALSNVGRRNPQPPLGVKQGTLSGTMLLVVARILEAVSYTFEWSLDQQTWTAVTWTKVRYTVTGLTSGKLYYFRVQALLRNGTTTNPIGPVQQYAP